MAYLGWWHHPIVPCLIFLLILVLNPLTISKLGIVFLKVLDFRPDKCLSVMVQFIPIYHPSYSLCS